MARRRRRIAGFAAIVALALGAAVAIAVGPGLLDRYGDELFSEDRCTVTLGDDTHTLTAEQTNNAALIAAEAERRGLPARAVTIAIATAIQESGLRNIDFGDRDSLGLFQQRPSQGWGTEEQVLDPYYSAGAFYDALVDVEGWQDLEVTVAAQAVQRSAFPDAYADHEPEARLWASALTGYSGLEAVACGLAPAAGDGASGRAVADRVAREFGGEVEVSVVGAGDGTTTFALDHPEVRLRDALAAWAVSTAGETRAVSVSWCVTEWTRNSRVWATDEEAAPLVDCEPTGVRVVVALD